MLANLLTVLFRFLNPSDITLDTDMTCFQLDTKEKSAKRARRKNKFMKNARASTFIGTQGTPYRK